ncbi:Bifunctional ligase/repressor BirA [Calidithermus terrae]|uniref:Bifunctional ligase/repressor BirA n=1 Tax=Calidithermus terrae TaxID=1408545 RepID=A0A399EI99_9DEIN|nr:biotin--[acetyl-CoA-carboxylase] ligase [Calidithermus terrae]RIH83678.1 Bifunctional ligase/repressor BirA [Calidithermus terrae]
MHHRLLNLLGEQFQPSRILGEQLGVDRDQARYLVQRLVHEGYPVEVSKALGVRVAPGTPLPHLLAPRLRGSFGQPYRYLGHTTSTQDELRRWAEEGAPEGAVVLAERQTAGRGRMGRPWVSAPGASLTFSLLLRPRVPVALLPLAVGVALREAVGLGGLKWPNDLLAPDGRKLAGILVEAKAGGPVPGVVVLGIGLNVLPPVPPAAAALSEFMPVNRADLLAGILEELENQYENLSKPERILEHWKKYSVTLGKEVSIRTPRGEMQGRALDLAEDGALVVESQGGTERIAAGDVSLIGRLGG